MEYDAILLAEQLDDKDLRLNQVILRHQLPPEKIVTFTGERILVAARDRRPVAEQDEERQ